MRGSRLSRKELLQGMAGFTLTSREREDRWSDTAAFIETEQKAGAFPGASLIASRQGKTAFERCWGTYCSRTEWQAPLRKETVHPFYSYSKLVSATVVAMAHQDGRLDYDAPIKTYIPEFVGGGKEKITLRHLLTHSAGIPGVPLGAVDTEEGWETAVKAMCDAKTEWEPGSKTAYHALTGMFTAAEAVRRVMDNKPWPQICQERLFTPLGARSLTFALPPASAPVALTPRPKELPKTLREWFGFAGHPAGGCFGTIADALKVLQLHLNQGEWHGRRLLTPQALEEMHRVQYRQEIARERAEGQPVVHEPWGLGPLLRGEGPKAGAHDWFGFGDQTSPGIFGHAGIDTVIGVADPADGSALFFVTTDSPKPPEKTVPLRNGVTDRVFEALSS